MVWRMVLVAAICVMKPAPTSGRGSSHSHETRDIAKAIRLRPNISVAAEITLPRPTTDVREARYTVPPSAPTPVAVISQPSVLGPPCSTLAAITGISTEYGIPIVDTIASRISAVRIGTEADT